MRPPSPLLRTCHQGHMPHRKSEVGDTGGACPPYAPLRMPHPPKRGGARRCVSTPAPVPLRTSPTCPSPPCPPPAPCPLPPLAPHVHMPPTTAAPRGGHGCTSPRLAPLPPGAHAPRHVGGARGCVPLAPAWRVHEGHAQRGAWIGATRRALHMRGACEAGVRGATRPPRGTRHPNSMSADVPSEFMITPYNTACKLGRHSREAFKMGGRGCLHVREGVGSSCRVSLLLQGPHSFFPCPVCPHVHMPPWSVLPPGEGA